MFRKGFALACAGAVALAGASAAGATTFPIGAGSTNFFITSGSPTSNSITATFQDSFSSPATFDDIFTFTIPQDGVGSGSISTSFSSALNQLTITELLINGVSYAVPATSSGQSTSVGGVNILANVLNTIEVRGFTLSTGGYSGTATFSATTAAVPEVGTWAMMVAGFGFLGFAMRRSKRTAVSFG